MAICFSALPNEYENSNKCFEAGKYTAIVASAEMKTPKQPSDGTKKPDYLAVRWDVYNEDMTTKVGAVFDNFTESTANIAQVKLKKFMIALDINLGDSFELADLCKVCKNKKAIINVKVGKDQQDNDRNEIDVFNDPYAKIPSVMPESFVNVKEEGDVPFGMNEPAAEADSNY